VLPEAVVMTDEYHVYKKLPRNGFADHRTIQHQAKVYVSGDVHTQTIEGFWSLVKRGISGTHHRISTKYLQGYLNEYVWRYNNRDDEGPALFALLILRAAFTRV
jgi:transposase